MIENYSPQNQCDLGSKAPSPSFNRDRPVFGSDRKLRWPAATSLGREQTSDAGGYALISGEDCSEWQSFVLINSLARLGSETAMLHFTTTDLGNGSAERWLSSFMKEVHEQRPASELHGKGSSHGEQ